MRGLSLVVASGDHSSLRGAGLSLSRPLLLRSTGSRCAGSVAVAHGPSCSAACGIFPDQGSNPCPLHWQADSQPLRHQGSPPTLVISSFLNSSHPKACEMVFYCGFDLHFLTDQWIWTSFHVLVVHLYLFKCLFKSTAHFLIGLHFCCCWVLYMFWIPNPYQMYDCKYFSHSVGFLFILLIMSFDSQIQKDKCYMILLILVAWNSQIYKDRK